MGILKVVLNLLKNLVIKVGTCLIFAFLEINNAAKLFNSHTHT